MLSIIFPAYNEEKNVAELHARLVSVLRALGQEFEIIAVNNASTDNTYGELKKLSPLKIISIAYNIGQTAALDAGIHAAAGDIVVTMDGDLQNDPADIPRMFAKLQEGYDAVVGWRQTRRDSLGRKIFSRTANYVTRRVLKLKIHDYACALKMFKAEFIKDIHLYGEMHVFLAAILQYRGARVVEMPVNHHERQAGLSKHNFIKGIKDLADLFTVKFIFGTSRPLLLFGGVGLGSWIFSGLIIIAAVVLKILDLRNFGQTPLPIMASLFIILGFVSVMSGLLAELTLRSYYEGKKQRPYKIKEVIEKD